DPRSFLGLRHQSFGHSPPNDLGSSTAKQAFPLREHEYVMKLPGRGLSRPGFSGDFHQALSSVAQFHANCSTTDFEELSAGADALINDQYVLKTALTVYVGALPGIAPHWRCALHYFYLEIDRNFLRRIAGRVVARLIFEFPVQRIFACHHADQR